MSVHERGVMNYRKKLIEVALPLEAINKESALRKRKAPAGYPTTLHKWWAQRPLAACRAVLFASLIDDPDQDGVPPALLAGSTACRCPRAAAPSGPACRSASSSGCGCFSSSSGWSSGRTRTTKRSSRRPAS